MVFIFLYIIFRYKKTHTVKTSKELTVNAICSFCSLSKEQKELIDKFGTSKEQISSI